MSNLQLKLLLKYLKIKDSQVTMQTLWGGDIMALKNMVNELVEIGFENASRALKFAGFISQSNKDGQEFEDAKEFIDGLCIEESIKDELISKCLAIEDGVTDRVVDSAEEYFRAGICFVLNFLFDANDFQKRLNEKLDLKKEGE